MLSFDDILSLHRLQRVELQAWIEQRWVRPNAGEHGPEFDEVDEARVTLICELREVCVIDDESLDVVLSLLDQLYATRRALKRVEQAIQELPESVQQQVRKRLHVEGDPSSQHRPDPL
jgi:chaperone modulatory protein CbpM